MLNYLLMATYSKTNLLDKIFIFNSLLRDYSSINPLFHSILPVYILVSIRALTVRERLINDYSISLTMAANKHAIGFKRLNGILIQLAELGMVRYTGKAGTKIYITELGKAALNELETILRTSHYKFNRDNSGKVKLPGVKRK